MSKSGDDKKNGKTRKILSLVFWLVILVAVVLVVLSLLPGKTAGQSLLSDILVSRTPGISVSEFNFEVGRDRVFAHANSHVASVGTLGLQVLGPDGEETLRSLFRVTSPTITEKGGFFLAYDIGGTSLRVFNASTILSSIETEGIIVSASINKNGWFCIVSQENTGFRSTVSVYNSTGTPVYMVNVGTGFVLSAELSADNKNLAILSMTERGSQITFYNGIDSHKDEPDDIYYFYSLIALDIEFITNTKLLAFTTQAVYIVDFSGGGTSLIYDFSAKRLAGYTYNDKSIIIHLYDYSIGYSGRTIHINFDGDVIAERESFSEFIAVALYRSTIVILQNDGFAFYDEQLKRHPASESSSTTATAGRILALSDDLALAAGDHFAIIIRRGEEN